MTHNKKFIAITAFGIITPIFLSFLNWQYSSYYFFKWGYRNINNISTASLIIVIISSLLILFLNNKKDKNISWNILSVIILLISLFYLYIIYSLSNFGF